MSTDILYEEILPRVFVYPNLIPNHEKYFAILKELHNKERNPYILSEPFPWSHFGTSMSYGPRYSETHMLEDVTRAISKNPHSEKIILEEKAMVEEVENAFLVSTTHYLKHFGLYDKVDDWTISAPSFDRYVPTPEEHINGQSQGQRLAMSHHSDYQIEREEMPGPKYVLTVTHYINDDYEGGDVKFLNAGKEISYKPKAGDVIVFPSGNPKYLSDEGRYFHAVGAIEKADKYFCRSFYMEPYEGSPEWLANQEKYGADVWEKMEQVRIAAGLRSFKQDPDIQIKKDGRTEIDIFINNILKDAGIDPEKECGLEEFRKKDNE